VSQLIDALSHVIRHRLGEIDHRILAASDPRELRMLWRVRRKLEDIALALTGRKARNPGKKTPAGSSPPTDAN
jgi:hypothetical protein